MLTFRLIFACGIFAFAGYVVYTFWCEYRESTAPKVWNRLLKASRNSATILWQKFVILIAAFGGVLGQFAELIDQPELKAPIQAALKPDYVAAFIVATALVSWW